MLFVKKSLAPCLYVSRRAIPCSTSRLSRLAERRTTMLSKYGRPNRRTPAVVYGISTFGPVEYGPALVTPITVQGTLPTRITLPTGFSVPRKSLRRASGSITATCDCQCTSSGPNGLPAVTATPRTRKKLAPTPLTVALASASRWRTVKLVRVSGVVLSTKGCCASASTSPACSV